ncbi:MAG TPA: HAD-IA family hydrolase [Pyrinomonadaceae bacterium]|jgi:3-amino-5-hydroxybenzoic acid synthesis related protein
MLKAVIFDLDGVLIDSEPLMRYAFERAYRHVIGSGTPPIESYLEHMGESFPRIMQHLGLPLTMWEPYRQLCRENIGRIQLFPQSRLLLAGLRTLRLKLAVLTGKDRERTLHTLEHFGLLHYFDAVVASDQLRQPKPHPEGVLHALDLLGRAPHEAVMIGDAVSDILCAQRAGVRAVAVTWGIKPELVQTNCRPDHVVHDWESLTALLLSLVRGVASSAAVTAGASPLIGQAGAVVEAPGLLARRGEAGVRLDEH